MVNMRPEEAAGLRGEMVEYCDTQSANSASQVYTSTIVGLAGGLAGHAEALPRFLVECDASVEVKRRLAQMVRDSAKRQYTCCHMSSRFVTLVS